MAAFLLILSLCAADPPAVLGWQPATEGGREYLIQLAPETLDQLRQGYAVCGTMPLPGGGTASYRITAGRGDLPRRDGESASAGRVNTAERTAGEPSGRWAAPATSQPMSSATGGSPASSGDRRDASATARGTLRIEDLPDALNPMPRSVEPAAATSRLGDLPPLERSASAGIGAAAQRSDQEYRPPGVGSGAGDAFAPRAASDIAKPTNASVPPPASAERSDSPPRPLLPISDIDRGTARPPERSTGTAAAAPSAMPNRGGGAAPFGSAGPTNRPSERPPGTASFGNQSLEAASSASQAVVAPEAKPWGTLVFVGALLFASLGLNFFLGWTAWDYRRRCESLTTTQNR